MADLNKSKKQLKFENDPNYREKLIANVEKQRDSAYCVKISQTKRNINSLTEEKNNEINRIQSSRWETFADGNLMVNRTEGKIKVNKQEVLFSDIQGANINVISGSRVVTTQNSKSKKHASLGGAIVGGVLLGPVGAAAGGVGLGNTETRGTMNSNQIMTCLHLGVMVNINGFVSEVLLISKEVDQTSKKFLNAQSEAANIVALLGALSKTPVPESYMLPEEAESVKQIDDRINQEQLNLQTAVDEKSDSNEQADFSYDEYLSYLKNVESMNKSNKQHFDGHVNISKISNVLLWIASVLCLILSFAFFSTAGAIASGIVYLLTCIIVNPLFCKFVNKNLFRMPVWVCAVVFVVGFCVGAALL